MTTPSSMRQEVTQLLGEWSGGDEGALERLLPLVQPELHRLAHHYMSPERAGHNLQTTAILNEGYLRLVDLRSSSYFSLPMRAANRSLSFPRARASRDMTVPAGICTTSAISL
jgi:ECF sigma factor